MTSVALLQESVPVLFAVNASREFGQRVARALNLELAAHEEREFEDGEHKIRPLENVRGRDVYVIQSLYGDAQQSVNDKLCRLVFFLGALRDADAGRVTAVIPYLAYARKDRKTQARDPVTTRYVAQMIESVGVDRVVTLDVHNLAAYQNAFRCHCEHLEASRLFIDFLSRQLKASDTVVVVSPDVGGIKRAERFRQALGRVLQAEPASAFVDKARARGRLRLGHLVGDVAKATVVVLDDLIASGSTVAHTARVCREHGAVSVHVFATHGLFVGAANENVADEAIDRVVVTDSVPPFRLPTKLRERKLKVLSSVELFACAIERMHTGGSIVDLLAK